MVRGRVVDASCFLLAVGCIALTLVDSLDQHLAPGRSPSTSPSAGWPVSGVWLRRRWPVGFAVTAGLFSVYSMTAGRRRR